MIAIYTLWIRQLKRYFRSKSRIVGSLGQPLLFLLALGFGMGPVFQAAGQGNYIEFLVPGVVAMSILFLSVFNGIEVIWDRQLGFLKETMVAPVPRWQIMLGRTLGGATVAVLQGIIVLIISLIAGFVSISSVWQAILVFIFMFLIALVFTALGTAIGSALEDMNGFHLIVNFLIMPIFFLSGALFPLENLPKVIDGITRANPLSYGVDGLRGALGGAVHMGLITDFWILGIIAVVIIGIGSYLFSKIQI